MLFETKRKGRSSLSRADANAPRAEEIGMRRTETEWAKRNLELAGLMSKDSDYEGMIGEAVCKLLDTHAAEGHSGASHYRTLQIFNLVAMGKTAFTLKFWQERFDDYNKTFVANGAEPWTEAMFEEHVMPKPGAAPK